MITTIIAILTCPCILGIFELLLQPIVLLALLGAPLAHLILLLGTMIMMSGRKILEEGQKIDDNGQQTKPEKRFCLQTLSPLSASMLVLAKLVTDTASRSSYLRTS